MSWKKAGIALIICLGIGFASENPGAVFLMIWPGARPTSLAGAFTAMAGPSPAARIKIKSQLKLRQLVPDPPDSSDTGEIFIPVVICQNTSKNPGDFKVFCFLVDSNGNRVDVSSIEVIGLEAGRDTALEFSSLVVSDTVNWTVRCSTAVISTNEIPAGYDAAMLYYNPGAVAFFERTNACLMHCNWLPGLWPGMYYEYLGITHNLPGRGVIGFNAIYLTTGETDVINERGEFLGRYTTFDVAPALSYAFPVLNNLGLGFTGKLIYSFLVPEWVWKVMPELGIEQGGTGITWAFDVGALYRPFEFMNVGLAVANIGPNISYTSSGESDPLPRMLRLGFAFYPVRNELFTLTITPEITKILVGAFSDTTRSFSEQWIQEWDDAWKSLGVEGELNLGTVGVAARAGYFEDKTGQRGGVVLEKEGLTYHYSLRDVISRRDLGKFKSLGVTFGGGIRFMRFQFDLGVDQMIYDFPTTNYKFSFSYRF